MPTADVRMIWPEGDDTPVLAANQFNLVRVGPSSEFLLAIGYATPPFLTQDSEPPQEIPVRVIARVSVTSTGLEQLQSMFQRLSGQEDEE